MRARTIEPSLRAAILRGDFPFELHEWLALVAPRPVWLRGTCDDPIFPAWQGLGATRAELAPLYEALDGRDALDVVVERGVHAFPAPAHDAAWAFLRRWL